MTYSDAIQDKSTDRIEIVQNLKESDKNVKRYFVSVTNHVKYNFELQSSTRVLNSDNYDLKSLFVNKRKIESIKNLKYNWNDNNAEPFDNALLESVSSLINRLDYQPKLFPTGRKSIQLEYHKGTDYLEFEIFINKTNYFLKKGNDMTESKIQDENQIITKVNEFFLT